MPMGTERNAGGYAAEVDKLDEHWTWRTKLTSTYASREANRVTDLLGLGKGGNDTDRCCCICYGTCIPVDMTCIPEDLLRTS